MKKIIILIGVIIAMLLTIVGCGEKITLHCDNCGKEVQADADSNMTEDWAIYCSECEKEIFSDLIVEE